MLQTNDLFKVCANSGANVIQLTDADIKQTQHELLEMANEIIFVFNKYNLTYTLGGGSALGAIRHQGFIPWDDDLDLNMPREDYDRFIKIFPAELGDKYWLHVPGGRKNFDLPFMQIRKKGTRVRNLLDMETEQCGLTIDTFPIENTYDNPLKRVIHGIGATFLLFVLSCYRLKIKQSKILKLIGNKPELIKAVKKKAVIAKLFSFFTFEKWLIISDHWFSRCKDDTSRLVVIPTGRKHFFGEMYHRKEFCTVKQVKFEDRLCNVTQDTDDYLTKLYGNYMELPPEEKREKHFLLEFKLNR